VTCPPPDEAEAWLLLDAAALAQKKLAAGDLPEAEKAFHTGRVQSALWFARNVLPQVKASARSLATEDASAIEIRDAALGTV
jgi:predicted Zn-dependent protease